jgi:hypothetical protein
MEHLPLCRGSVRGTWRRGFVSGDFERQVERALVMEHLPLCMGLCKGHLEEGFRFWGL